MLRVNADGTSPASVVPDASRQARASAAGSRADAELPTLEAAARNPARPTRNQLLEAVDSVNQAIRARNVQIEFEIDDRTSEVITRIVDRTSGELIRQIPAEEVVRIARAMSERPGPDGSVPLVHARA